MMDTLITLSAVAAWIGCGVVSHGLMYARFQGRYPLIASETEASDFHAIWIELAIGPIGLLSSAICLMRWRKSDKKFYGFQLRRNRFPKARP